MSTTKSQMVFGLKSQCGADIPHPDGGTTWTTPWLANDELCNRWALERAKEWGAKVVILASAMTKADEPSAMVTVNAAAIRQAREALRFTLEVILDGGDPDERSIVEEALCALGGTP